MSSYEAFAAIDAEVVASVAHFREIVVAVSAVPSTVASAVSQTRKVVNGAGSMDPTESCTFEPFTTVTQVLNRAPTYSFSFSMSVVV